MTAVRHRGFLKFKFYTVGAVKGPILHQRPTRCGDIAISVI